MSARVRPFARRCDSDGATCLVLNDPEHSRGTILLSHDGIMPGHGVESVVDAFARWFEQAHEKAGHG